PPGRGGTLLDLKDAAGRANVSAQMRSWGVMTFVESVLMGRGIRIMPSLSLQLWRTTRINALDEIEAAHRSIGGTGPGRRYATQQINQAYAVLLSSQFQGYCRDLHSESADYLVQGITPALLKTACRNAMVQNRKLNQGNPNPGNLGSDFNRFGLVLWDEV